MEGSQWTQPRTPINGTKFIVIARHSSESLSYRLMFWFDWKANPSLQKWQLVYNWIVHVLVIFLFQSLLLHENLALVHFCMFQKWMEFQFIEKCCLSQTYEKESRIFIRKFLSHIIIKYYYYVFLKDLAFSGYWFIHVCTLLCCSVGECLCHWLKCVSFSMETKAVAYYVHTIDAKNWITI